uniref:Hydrogenase assembly chaperone HypC/HupF n=1 Tax=Magnetococcus massalia (strain MO-1) TaxID=451514 RepID=A0A1S7LCB7_MAGMO|nr:Hydrogenase assembly chaperone HypC/HupF [Candidatus Magnetococcus massalia]
MCLAHPARIVAIDEASDSATVELGGIKQQVSLALVEGVQVDSFVLVHVGYALNTISEEEAAKTLALFAEAGIGPDGLPLGERSTAEGAAS